MSEAYWFGSFTTPDAAHLSAALGSLGFQMNWIEEIHWVNCSAPPEKGAAHFPLQYEWPAAGRPLRLLHALLHEIIHNHHHTLLWVEAPSAPLLTGMVLGGPATVGRYNLLPQYRLLPLPAAATDDWQKQFALWQAWMEGETENESPPGWVVCPSTLQTELLTWLPQARFFSPSPSTNFTEGFLSVVGNNRSASAAAGLWIDEHPPHLALLVEKR